MKEKVLITGANGFVGYHLLQAALSRGYDVHAAVRKNSVIDHLKVLPVGLVQLQYDENDFLKKQLDAEAYDYIIHAGGLTRAFNQVEYDVANVGVTGKLVHALQGNTALKKMVLISSLAAIGPLQNANEQITEKTMARPVTAYGRSKRVAELTLQQSALPWVIIRPTAVYGPREKDLLQLMKSVAKGWDVYIGKTEQQLSFVYVKDLAEAVLNAMEQPVYSEDYNITDGKVYSRYEMANTILHYLNKNARRFHLPYGLVKSVAFLLEQGGRLTSKMPLLNVDKLHELTALNWNCAIDKAVAQLHYHPQYHLSNGLTETIDWYQQNKWM